MKSILRSFVLAAVMVASACSMSCTGIMAGVTGQPIVTEPVKTADGREIKVASADVLRTKAYPLETAWGLYNAGLVAQRAAEVIDTGKYSSSACSSHDPPVSISVPHWSPPRPALQRRAHQ